MQQTLLTVIVTVFWAGLYFFVPVLSPYAARLGAGLGLIGLVVGSYGFTQLVLRIPAGWLSDRMGRRKPFVLAGFLFTAISALMMYGAPSAWYLVIGRGFSGVAATMWVALSVLVAGAFPPERAIAAMGLAQFGNSLGQIIGTGAGGWAAERWGWGAPFLLSAVVAVAGALLSRHLLTVSLLSALLQYVTHVTIFGFTPIFAQSLGATRAELGWLTVAGLLPQAVAALLADRLANRFGVVAVLVGALAGLAASVAAVPNTSALPVLYAVQALGGAARGLAQPLLMGLSIQAVPGARRAMAMGVFQSVYAGGMFIGPVVAGAVGQAWGLPRHLPHHGGRGAGGRRVEP